MSSAIRLVKYSLHELPSLPRGHTGSDKAPSSLLLVKEVKTLIRTSPLSRRLVLSTLAAIQLVSGVACSERTRQAAGETRIAQLAKKHGAKTDWTASLRRANGSAASFTFELQNALDPLIGRPILAIVDAGDIYRTMDGYRLICQLSASGPASRGWESLHFVVDLPLEKARKLADVSDAQSYEVFAIVIVPIRADVRFSREVEVLQPESTDDEATLDVGRSFGRLWVRATLLDVEHLPGY